MAHTHSVDRLYHVWSLQPCVTLLGIRDILALRRTCSGLQYVAEELWNFAASLWPACAIKRSVVIPMPPRLDKLCWFQSQLPFLRHIRPVQAGSLAFAIGTDTFTFRLYFNM